MLTSLLNANWSINVWLLSPHGMERVLNFDWGLRLDHCVLGKCTDVTNWVVRKENIGDYI